MEFASNNTDIINQAMQNAFGGTSGGSTGSSGTSASPAAGTTDASWMGNNNLFSGGNPLQFPSMGSKYGIVDVNPGGRVDLMDYVPTADAS